MSIEEAKQKFDHLLESFSEVSEDMSLDDVMHVLPKRECEELNDRVQALRDQVLLSGKLAVGLHGWDFRMLVMSFCNLLLEEMSDERIPGILELKILRDFIIETFNEEYCRQA